MHEKINHAIRAVRYFGVLIPLVVVGAVAGCGGSNGEGTPSTKEKTVVQPGANVPKGARTEVAKVLEKPQKGIPAQKGQWMVEIGVVRHGLHFTVGNVVAPPGNANFHLENPQALGHDLTIEAVGVGSTKTPVVHEGGAWVRVSLFPGKRYVFYCSVPGHRAAGMEGTITVDPHLKAKDLKAY